MLWCQNGLPLYPAAQTEVSFGGKELLFPSLKKSPKHPADTRESAKLCSRKQSIGYSRTGLWQSHCPFLPNTPHLSQLLHSPHHARISPFPSFLKRPYCHLEVFLCSWRHPSSAGPVFVPPLWVFGCVLQYICNTQCWHWSSGLAFSTHRTGP